MKEINHTQHKFTLVDDDDYEWLSQWMWFAKLDKSTKSFYAVRGEYVPKKKNNVMIYMHKEILELPRNSRIEGDHVNNDTLNNQRYNLRRCTRQEQNRNRRVFSNNKLGLKCITEYMPNKYRVRILIGRK